MSRGLRRSPLLHFLLLGGLLYLAKAFAPDSWQATSSSIAISETDIERLRSDWQRESGREPSEPEMKASLGKFLDEEMLIREALRLSLDQRDAVVRRRLLMNMRFAFPVSQDDDESLLREARRLEMSTRDLVARRRLIQLMETRLAGQAAVSDDEVRAYLALHLEQFSKPSRRAFHQVFFSANRGDTDNRAKAQLAQLKQRPDLSSEGDQFLLGSAFAPQSAEEITAAFGLEFAAMVMHAPEREWVGPVSSPYGLHLIHVDASEAAMPAPFASVRTQAAYALMHERERRMLQAELSKLRRRYPVSMVSAAEKSWP